MLAHHAFPQLKIIGLDRNAEVLGELILVDVGKQLETLLAGETSIDTFRVIETVKILFLDGIVEPQLLRHCSKLRQQTAVPSWYSKVRQ